MLSKEQAARSSGVPCTTCGDEVPHGRLIYACAACGVSRCPGCFPLRQLGDCNLGPPTATSAPLAAATTAATSASADATLAVAAPAAAAAAAAEARPPHPLCHPDQTPQPDHHAMPVPQVIPPPAPQPRCTHLLAAGRTWDRSGAACANHPICTRVQPRGSCIWTCGACKLVFCPACRKDGYHTDPQPHPQTPQVSPSPGDAGRPSIRPSDLDQWEKLATAFPTQPITPTYKFIPKQLQRRYADIRLRALHLAMDAELSPSPLPPERIAAWSALARIIPFLLLHRPRKPDPASPEAPTSVRKELTRRMLLAEQGQYSALLSEAGVVEKTTLRHRDAAPLTQRTRQDILAAACDKAEDGCLRSATQLLLGDATLPPTPTTADAVEQLYTLQPKAPMPSPHRGATTQIPTRTITTRIHKLRGTAHPGPSGERNTHIRALLQSPHGPATLTKWTNMWLRPALTTHFRKPWLSSGMVPLDKGGGKPRPIVFQECLLKLAAGSIVDSQASMLHLAAGAWQFGIYHPGGAIDLIWRLRAAMAAAPQDVFTTVDCKNAFGEVHRGAALRTAERACPTFGRLLHNLWQGVDTAILIPDGPTTYRTINVHDGLVQGGCEAAPAFALALHEAVEAFLKAARTNDTPCQVWAYMDDLYIQCNPRHWYALMNDLTARLNAIGLECRPDKSYCFIPSPPPPPPAYQPPSAATPVPEPPPVPTTPADFACHATLQPHGLPTLGTASDGQYATTLSPTHPSCTEIEERLDKAQRLGNAIREILAATLTTPRHQPCWRLLDGVLNQCLSYDAAVSHPGVTAPFSARLDDLVFDLALSILDHPTPTPTFPTQLRLDRSKGGGGLRSAVDRSYTAYLASAFRLGYLHHELGTLQHLTPTLQSCLAHLRSLAIALDPFGMPHHSGNLAGPSFDPALHLTTPMPKRQRAWWEHIDAKRGSIIAETQPDCTIRIASCGGPEGGAYLKATRADGINTLPDRFFIATTRLRFGLPVLAPGICAHTTKDNPPRRCPEILDVHGLHACTCKVGGAPYAAHGSGCNILLRATQSAGYQSRREQIVPEFATPATPSPQIDVEGWGLLGQPRLLVDFTIRNPLAQRYVNRDLNTAAHTDKTTHYVATHGLQVIPATIDTFGKHSPHLASLLEHLAGLARNRERQMGLPPTRWLRKWRSQLSSVLAHMTGRAICQAAQSPQDVCGARCLSRLFPA